MIGRRGFLGALAAMAALPRLPEPARAVQADLWRSIDGGAPHGPFGLRGITDDGTLVAYIYDPEPMLGLQRTLVAKRLAMESAGWKDR